MRKYAVQKPVKLANRHRYTELVDRMQLMPNDDLKELVRIFDRASLEADMDSVDEPDMRQADAYERQGELCENLSAWADYYLDARQRNK